MVVIDQPEEGRMEPTESGIHLPSPTIWPVVLGAGIAVLAFGVLTNVLFTISGAALIAISIGGWIGELRHE